MAAAAGASDRVTVARASRTERGEHLRRCVERRISSMLASSASARGPRGHARDGAGRCAPRRAARTRLATEQELILRELPRSAPAPRDDGAVVWGIAVAAGISGGRRARSVRGPPARAAPPRRRSAARARAPRARRAARAGAVVADGLFRRASSRCSSCSGRSAWRDVRLPRERATAAAASCGSPSCSARRSASRRCVAVCVTYRAHPALPPPPQPAARRARSPTVASPRSRWAAPAPAVPCSGTLDFKLFAALGGGGARQRGRRRRCSAGARDARSYARQADR